MTFQEQYHERLVSFAETFTEEEADTFVRSLVVFGEALELGFGLEFAGTAMASLYNFVVGSEPSEKQDWRDTWQDLDSSADLALTAAMHQGRDLNSFAYYGILVSWELPRPLPPELEVSLTNVPAYIEAIISMYEKFMGLFGDNAPTWGFDNIERTILAARGRLKIDENLPVTVHELAALSRVVPKRVQNAIYAGSDQSPVLEGQGLVTPASARAWLEARAYLPSIWQEGTDGCNSEASSSEALNARNDEEQENDYLFVPEAPDGSLFAPSICARGNGDEQRFTIGDKGNERSVIGYEQALSELTRMKNPKWRRPNANGNWGIIRAERWRRIRRADLERL